MSGFIAIASTDGSPIDRGLLEQMTASLGFRGPDDQQVWHDGSVGLGHTLFRTTDEAKFETQPTNLDRQFWITGSIRIDARKDLVDKLNIARQLNLPKTPDCELVLYAYQKWGEKCVEHLLGDFAFAIWDVQKRKLFCAKDHFGMRQLYYAQTKNTLVISNSLHCILSHPHISKSLNDKAIAGFLLFGDHTWLDKSISAFRGVQVLLPAHSLSLNDGNFSKRQYWVLPTETRKLNYQNQFEYIEHFQEVFSTAIADRIRTDRIVVSMSGGMDSSAVAAIANDLMHKKYSSPELKAATVVFQKTHLCEERYYASLVAEYIGIPIQFTQGDDFPFWSSPIQTTRPLEIDQLALWLEFERRKHLLGRVTLTGDAADNLLRYPSTAIALKETGIFNTLSNITKMRQRYGVFPGLGTGLKAKLRGWTRKNNRSHRSPYPYPSWLNPDFQDRVKLKELWDDMWEPHTIPTYKRTRHSLLQESLLKPDWTDEDFMMHSNFVQSEHNDPFLDLRLVNLIQAIPALPWLFHKDILRKSLNKKLPREVLNRPKTPLGHVQSSVLEQPELQRLDKWRATAELNQYIDRSKIPGSTGDISDPLTSYVNARPLLLNNWLKRIRDK